MDCGGTSKMPLMTFHNLLLNMYDAGKKILLRDCPKQAPLNEHRQSNGAQLHLLCSRPGTLFCAGEPIIVSVFNPDNIPIEVVVIKKNDGKKNTLVKTVAWTNNPVSIKLDFGVGDFQIVARELNPHNAVPIRSNSISPRIVDETEENLLLVEKNRVSEHKIQCAIQSTSNGVLTLHNPWITPGNSNFPAEGKWFPTSVWEGCTSLYNEEQNYYLDPQLYFINSIKQLIDKGFNFITWHQVLDNQVDHNQPNILLQFDVDAGNHSIYPLVDRLVELGVKATVMLHWRARHWYVYDFKDMDVKRFQNLENLGWAFGYHNNTLTNLVGHNKISKFNAELLSEATTVMSDEIEQMRKYLTIRTMTHHGGNTLNYTVPIPQESEIICVDKNFSPEMWTEVDRAFSDGGFTSRPTSLQEFVRQATANDRMLFMRCHPIKYGNYPEGIDAPQITQSTAGVPRADELISRIQKGEVLNNIEKQTAWLSNRSESRGGVQLGYATIDKPLSSQFVCSDDIKTKIKALRARRRPGFLRQYPWADGDPRVIWWRILATFCREGEVLNVGAMPPEQKDETVAFLKPNSNLLEVDIDPDREPDIVADFCSPSRCVDTAFSCVLLNGLPYFSDPKAAVMNTMQYLQTGGSLLIGAAAASHPERGGLFRPTDRPIWRLGNKEKDGESLSLKTTLWSFDDKSIDQLMSGWSGSWKAEFMSHYWFIVAELD